MIKTDIPPTLLVIARSARMLAKMAVDAGFVPVAIDCFADTDTRRLALDAVKVPSLDLAGVRPAVDAMRGKYGLTHVVYGSGFEECTETLAFLEQDWVVLGNSVEVFKRFQDKPAFFDNLAALSIPCPETLFSPAIDGGNWLVKPMLGEGGVGIRRHDPNHAVNSSECYWQRFLEGEPLSVLFVACRGQANVLGFNRQWAVAIEQDQPFLFAGVANHADVSAEHRRQVSEWLTKLARIYPLRGLGSLDFIVAEGRCYLLEINARIPASAQLYDESVFTRHVQACLGVLEDADIEPPLPAAYQIVYAQKDTWIPCDVSWPDWAVDRPDGGAFIGKGQPICSIIATGKSPSQAAEHLRCRQQVIEKLLNTGS